MITIYETPQELEQAAQAAGFSMRSVCAKAGLAHTTWYRWKNAHTQPTYENRLKLGRAIEDLQSQARN